MILRYLKNMKFAVIAMSVTYLLFLTACMNETEDKTVKVSISPTSKTAELGDSVELTVTAKNTGIIWPDLGENEGRYTVSGDKVTYIPPLSIGKYKFTVAAEANPSKHVTANITVVYASPEITITPENPPEIKIGKTIQFTAHQEIPTGQPKPQDTLWEVSSGCGTIDQDGLFSAAVAGSCSVTASLRDINNKKISESVNVTISDTTLDDIPLDMVLVPGGTFTMGCTLAESDCYSRETPAHQVTLGEFYIGKYEVTQDIWKKIMGINYNPSGNSGNNFPVENVSWDDIQTFLERLNDRTDKTYRLPTEAEWEYAARGGSQNSTYIYSGSNNLDDVGWYYDNSDLKTHPVGVKKANGLGIYDMSGNVDEWVSDFYNRYSNDPKSNPVGPESGSEHVVRGGSALRDEDAARVFSRGGYSPDFSNPRLGFRLVITSIR